MKFLVIPDVHLKPWMFNDAENAMNLLQKNYPNDSWNYVCLGDIPDDWGRQGEDGLYRFTWNRAIKFAVDHPDALWCYGNHDVSYIWNRTETGFSFHCQDICRDGLRRLQLQVRENIQFLHLVDNVLFSHGGLCSAYVSRFVASKHRNNIPFVINRLNKLDESDMWHDWSPLWFRPPAFESVKMYYPRKLLQVVGHTPTKEVYHRHGVVMCDSFSTDPSGVPYGEEKFVVVDTVTKEYFKV